MVKDMEKRVLRLSLSGKFLHIVQDQYVYTLVEIDEIIRVVRTYGIRILDLEQMGRDVQDSFLRIQFFHPRADSIDEMGLTHSRRPVQK